MTVSSVKEAWSKANEIFPGDYMHDSDCSNRAGYDIYWSTTQGLNAWISDLGDRLEVNLPNGNSVNIWIDENAAEEKKPATEEDPDATFKQWKEVKDLISNSKFRHLYAPEVALQITIPVMGYKFDIPEEKKIFHGLEDLCFSRTTLAYDIITKYCEDNKIPWGGMSGGKVCFYHNTNKEQEGHAIVSAYVSASRGKELEFLAKCAEAMTSADRL